MLQKRQSVDNQHSVEIQQDEKDEGPMNQKIQRTKEDVKKIFLENYLKKNKLDPTSDQVKEAGLTDALSDLVEDLSNRELANSKRLSKVIGQKVKFRDRLIGKSSDSVEENEEEKDYGGDSIKTLREIEQKKAVETFLPTVLKEFKDEGLTSEIVYDQLQKVYRTTDDDVRREDFQKRLDEAFAIAYPKLFRERVRREERKRLYEEDPSPNGSSSLSEHTEQKRGTVPKHGSAKAKVVDWYKKS